jgi:drug/metabolite transporter (DMT)-like permease
VQLLLPSSAFVARQQLSPLSITEASLKQPSIFFPSSSLDLKTPLQTSEEQAQSTWSAASFLPFANKDSIVGASKDTSLSDNSNNNNNDDEKNPQQFELNLWTARALLLFVAAVWGTNFASVKYLEGLCFHPPCHHPPSEFAFARFGIAALVSWPLLVGQPLGVILAGLECGVTITIGYITQAMALTTISAGKCAFICSLTVVLVPVLSAVLYGKPIKGSTVIAAAVALTGVGVLEGMVDVQGLLGISEVAAETSDAVAQAITTTPAVADMVLPSLDAAAAIPLGPLESLAQALGVGKGDLIALGQPLGFGYSFLKIEHYQEQFKDVPNRVLTIAAAQCVAVGFLSLLWVLYDYHGVLPDFSYLMEPHRVATLLWTGIVTTVAAIFLEGIALQKASATDASIAFSSEPVWASLFGFLLLREQLGIDAYVGGAIIMTACFIGAAADFKEQEDSKRLQGLEP